jgi:tetratricopeptide (TPR) repeat protein
VPPALDGFVLKCLEKNPLDRFYDQGELADRLHDVYLAQYGQRYVLPPVPPHKPSQAELVNRGDSLMAIGKYDAALDYYNRLDRDLAIFWQRYGTALARKGRYDEALVYLDKALHKEPSYLEATLEKIQVLIDLGRLDEALQTSSEALALNPKNKELLRFKRQLLQAAGSTQTAPPPGGCASQSARDDCAHDGEENTSPTEDRGNS